MPWKVFEEAGKYCVHKLKGDGSKGAKVKCHDTEKEAQAHKRALYANEPGSSKASAPVLVTVPNIPWLEAGVDYQLSTGKTSFTPEDLRDIVTAAMEDPSIPKPRIKIGHVDPRFNSAPFDGTPAFGKMDNLRLSENGMVIYADAVGVPKWLADIMPTAFPSRSVEVFWNIESNTGKKWRAVCSAAALLGVQWPGVNQLEDLPQYYGEEIPDGVVVDVAASHPTGGDPMKTEASANLDDVRRAFYQEYIPENQSEALWWWIRQVLTDPNELLVEDDETGQLYMIPFSSDAEGNVSFEDSRAVRMDFVPDSREAQKSAAAHAAAALADTRQVLASYDSRASSRPDEERGGMDPKAIRERLGLPEDATDEQVQEKVRELNSAVGFELPAPENVINQAGGVSTGKPEPAVPGEEPTPTPEKPLAQGQQPPEEEPAPQAATASAGNGNKGDVVTLDRGTFEQLQQGSQAALRLEKQFQTTAIENEVAAAIGDGRIPPARKEHWVKLLEADFEGGKATLASFEKGLIPVDQRGVGHSPEAEGLAEEEQVRAWTDDMFPETRHRRERETALASAGGQRPLIQREEGF